jgi:hypothetical protein
MDNNTLITCITKKLTIRFGLQLFADEPVLKTIINH